MKFVIKLIVTPLTPPSLTKTFDPAPKIFIGVFFSNFVKKLIKSFLSLGIKKSEPIFGLLGMKNAFSLFVFILICPINFVFVLFSTFSTRPSIIFFLVFYLKDLVNKKIEHMANSVLGYETGLYFDCLRVDRTKTCRCLGSFRISQRKQLIP